MSKLLNQTILKWFVVILTLSIIAGCQTTKNIETTTEVIEEEIELIETEDLEKSDLDPHIVEDDSSSNIEVLNESKVKQTSPTQAEAEVEIEKAETNAVKTEQTEEVEQTEQIEKPSSKQPQDASAQNKTATPIQEPTQQQPAPVKEDTKTSENITGNQQVEPEVTITIDGKSVKGIILPSISLLIEEGETVLDVLKKVTKAKRIQFGYRGRGATAYVEGIDNLYEFDEGPTSGWMYSVNGQFISKSAGAITVKKGDEIVWVYTLDLGKDIGARMQ